MYGRIHGRTFETGFIARSEEMRTVATARIAVTEIRRDELVAKRDTIRYDTIRYGRM